MTAVAAMIVVRLVAENLPGDVIAVLLGIEQAPAALERLRNLGAEETEYTRIAVGKMPAGDFVVALIVERPRWRCKAAEDRIQRRGYVAALRENTDGLRAVCVAGFQIEQPCGVERVALGMQRVAGVFNEDDVIGIPKAAIVEACVDGVRAL